MPPKKKSIRGRKVTKKKADSSDADCMPVEEMPREKLELFVQRLHKELKREREERRLFKMERDKINSFWEICLEKLQDCKAELRRKDYEIFETQEKNMTKLNMFKQKVKVLMCEHQSAIADMQTEGVINVKLAEDGYTQISHLLYADNKHLQRELLEEELTFHQQVKNLKLQHRRETSDLRATYFMSDIPNMYRHFENKLKAARTEVVSRHRSEIAKLEMEKDVQISHFIENHEDALSEIKHYYDDIIMSNFNNIGFLKEELINVQKQEKVTRKQLRNAVAQHRELSEPLKRATAEAEALKKEVSCHDIDKTLLVNGKARLMKFEKELENLKYENEVLYLQIEELQEEQDSLRKGFTGMTLDVQQKSSLKGVLLQSKLSVLVELLQQKDAQVVELLAASRKSVGSFHVTEQKIRDILKAKNTVIQDLQFMVSRATQSREDLVHTYWTKLHEYGISSQELELAPLEVTVKGLLKQQQPAP